MNDLPPDLMELFIRAGWKPGRRVEPAIVPPPGHPAVELLQSFSGLRIGESKSGIECAAGDVAFTSKASTTPEIRAIERLSGERLVAIARTHQDYAILYIGDSGRCFGACDLMEAPWLDGETFVDAIRSIITGRCVRPILLPGQESATVYGYAYKAGDPRLYDVSGGRS